jgi:hypothetical protein
MKKWPFAGLKIGSTRAAVKIWHDDFSWYHRWNRNDELYQLVVTLHWRDNQQIINFDKNIDDSLGKPREYCES